MTRYVALLRAINVGKRQVPMAELRAIAEGLGGANVQTYVASGNLIFDSDRSSAELEDALEQALEQRFGFKVETLVRSAAQWRGYLKDNPLMETSEATPNLVMISVGRLAATEADVAAMRAKAGENERIERAGDVLWIHFGDGSARSKLGSGPAKAIWTTRNWRTVQKLAEMLDA